MKSIKSYIFFVNESNKQKLDNHLIQICSELYHAYLDFNLDNGYAESKIDILEEYLDICGLDVVQNQEFENLSLSKENIKKIEDIYSEYKQILNTMPSLSEIKDRFLALSDDYKLDIIPYCDDSKTIKYHIGISNFIINSLDENGIDHISNFFDILKHIKKILKIEYEYIRMKFKYEAIGTTYITLYNEK